MLDNFKKIILGLALRLIAQLWPSLMAWPFGGIITYFISWAIDVLLHEAVLGGLFIWFDWSTKTKLNAVEKALKDILEYQGEMNAEEIKEHEDKLAGAYFELIELSRVRKLSSNT